jgi:DNA-binding transcriptional regulator YdaS (Cro superfamily)
MTHPIKTWLDDHHLKQWMFADMLGLDESTLSCYISGKRNMTINSAVTIERETKKIDPGDYLRAADLLLGENK